MYRDKDVIVIGAGAAGMMAALTAADRGLKVLLLEKMDQPGRKLRITGKGRCNLTNTAPVKDFIAHVGSDGRFMRNIFARFFNQELMDFFEKRNVLLVVERGNRVFPQSGKSLDIFLALITAIEEHPNIEIRKNCVAKALLTETEEGSTRITGVQLRNLERVAAPKVILAAGGCSYPTTGSTGDGYRLAAEAGHTIVEPIPSLVPLECEESVPAELEGFVLKNVKLSICRPDGKRIFEQQGEMTFTRTGLAGPLVMSASRQVTRMLHNGEQLKAIIDLKPALDPDQLDRKLIAELNANGTRIFNDALRLWLPAELIPLALQRLHIEYYKRLHQINGAERKRLAKFLKNVEFTLTGTRDFDEAIVTQGGVSLKEVNPSTLESKLVGGLHFAGEVLDLDADTGGYNLQIAFSTGYAAGMSV